MNLHGRTVKVIKTAGRPGRWRRARGNHDSRRSASAVAAGGLVWHAYV